MNKTLLALYGLKFNPFSPELPTEALHITPQVEQFCWRVEHALIREGGFALIQGDPGTGKSAVLRLLDERLGRLPELSVAAISHPSSNLADFYREMGDLFAVELRPHNRWGGFKALRERWLSHLEATLLRPVILLDEAQEMHPAVLNELRLLTSAHFDSRTLLSVILAGDARLATKLRREELLPLGSRIRTRLHMDYTSREGLLECLKHLQRSAGNPSLMTAQLMNTLCEHALGNYRVLTTMAAELLATAAQQERTPLDEQLYLEVFGAPAPVARKRA
jgi:type II secretory pathway predicted ATPase ExeA